jgi:hypothetical protein
VTEIEAGLMAAVDLDERPSEIVPWRNWVRSDQVA